MGETRPSCALHSGLAMTDYNRGNSVIPDILGLAVLIKNSTYCTNYIGASSVANMVSAVSLFNTPKVIN